MNAPNPNAGERDLDALRRAQRAHEPSMEEILASIRSIIADDREPRGAQAGAEADSRRRGAADRLFQGRAAAAPRRRNARAPRAAAAAAESAAPKVVWRQPESEPVAVAPAVRPEPAAERGAADFPPDQSGRFGRVRGAVGESGAAERRTGGERDARNPAPDAEEPGSTRICRAWSNGSCAPKFSAWRAAGAEAGPSRSTQSFSAARA